MKLLSTICFFFVFNLVFSQSVIYVNQNTTNNNSDGKTWQTAYPSLSKAIAASVYGSQIWIAQGTYFPSSMNNKQDCFQLKNGVKVYGGFLGQETMLNQRNWQINTTILSGDIGIVGDSTDNSFNILCMTDVDSTTIIDGLHFKNANADSINVFYFSEGRTGGAIKINSVQSNISPIIQNCTFINNRANLYGGAIYFHSTNTSNLIDATILNCTFTNSNAYIGGAIYIDTSNRIRNILLKNSIFINNKAGSEGGAFYYYDGFGNATISIDSCTFKYNSALGGVGGAVCYESNTTNTNFFKIKKSYFLKNSVGMISGVGGAISIALDNKSKGGMDIQKSIFEENQSSSHAAISVRLIFFTELKLKLDNCIFFNNQAKNGGCIGNDIDIYAKNCIFSNNKAEIGAVFYSNAQNVTFSNSLFYNNIAFLDGGIINSSRTNVTFNNCTLYNNKALRNGGLMITTGMDVKLELNNTIIQKCYAKEQGAIALTYNNLLLKATNIITDFPICDTMAVNGGFFSAAQVKCSNSKFATSPQFLHPEQGDFHLSPCSPAINAGDDAVLDSLGITTDIEGKPRVVGGRVDIGAYERQSLYDAVPTVKGSCSGQQGSVAFEIKEGTPPYNYQWQQGGTLGTSLSNLAQGTYQFTVSDAAGCKDSLAVVVPKTSSTLQLEGILKNDIRCFGEKNGSIQLLPQGGTPPFQYVWSNNTIANPVQNLTKGNYTATVTDAEGCSGVSTPIFIDEPSALKIAQFDIKNATGPAKKDGYVVIEKITGGTPPYTYKWSNGSTDTLNNHLAPENYTLTVTDAKGCFEVLGFGVTWQIATTELTETEGIVYPNPVTSEGTLHLNNTASFETLTLVDVLGRVVLTVPMQVQQEVAIRLPSLGSGIYLLCLKGKGGKISKKLVVE